MNLRLIKPTTKLENQYADMMQDWFDSGDELVPFILKYDFKDFKKFIEQINGFEKGIDIHESFIAHSTFWLMNDDNKILGVVNIRHDLTPNLKKEGGHIGYGIRPTERRKGYATKILELALVEAKKLGIKRALITCNHDNIGSIKTILNNKGEFFEENMVDQKKIRKYWIEN